VIKMQKAATQLPFSFLRRIEECKSAPLRSNCIGTALFITDVQRKDKFVRCESAHSIFLRHLTRTDVPIPGALVAWAKVSLKGRVLVRHMGIVRQVEPNGDLLITNRVGANGPIRELESASDTSMICGYNHSLVEANPKTYKEYYYLPPVLQQY
jgi:hypothetical protein